MAAIPDHEARFALVNELHARPFPQVEVPSRAVFLAIKRAENAAGRDRAADRAHLVDLLDRHGASHPPPDATHHFGRIGRYRLKWESHIEFVTYTLFEDGRAEDAFAADAFDVFPADWLAAAPGVRVTSALFRVERNPGDAEVADRLGEWFARDSLAVSRVLDASATVACDFRIDASDHMRFAVFAAEGASPQRIGRIVQRLCEVETYKAMALLGLVRVRAMAPELGRLESRLTALVAEMAGADGAPTRSDDVHLRELLADSAALEALAARSSFRLGASAAYSALVTQRVGVLREERFQGRQTFNEFMARRFDPAMRTVAATGRRLEALTERAARAADLLRTRVDVERSAQNQKLLESMNRRADLQLRLQKTVEGLSVVAISYYAVNLATYVLYPVAGRFGLDKAELSAALVVPVVAGVWWLIHRIRKHVS